MPGLGRSLPPVVGVHPVILDTLPSRPGGFLVRRVTCERVAAKGAPVCLPIFILPVRPRRLPSGLFKNLLPINYIKSGH